MNSPIEYFGGKTYMTDILQSYFPEDYDIYIEGFGGGASLLLNKKPDHLEIYNDLEKNVYSLFYVLHDNELWEKLQTELGLTYYSKAIHNDFIERLKDDSISIFDRAYYFIYVNRSSYNGVGGFVFNPLVRRGINKKVCDYLSCIEGLKEIHERLMNVFIENRDIFDLLDKYDNENVFFYLDPPYVQSTRKSNQKYKEDMTDELHVKLVERLSTIRGKVLLSGYDTDIYDPLINEHGWHKYTFKSPNALSDATEVLWCNYEVTPENKVDTEEQELFD